MGHLWHGLNGIGCYRLAVKGRRGQEHALLINGSLRREIANGESEQSNFIEIKPEFNTREVGLIR